MLIQFFVPGIPAPGGSKKGFYIKSINRVVIAPANKNTKPWMATVSVFAKEAYLGELLQGALKLYLSFHILRPKGHYNKKGLRKSTNLYPIVKPDLTKLERSTEDALVGIIMSDDSQIVKKETEKVYVDRYPGVMVGLEKILN